MFNTPAVFLFCIIVLCFFLSATFVSAGSKPMVIDINEGIEEVPFEAGDVDKRNVSSFVETIELSKSKAPYFDLANVIENTNGIQLRKSGGIGNFVSISIRGKSADQVTVYLDGMPINNASGGSVDLSRIPINQIARIDIYKDNLPVEFSEVANGGVINIITHRSNEKKINLSFTAGSFQTKQSDFNVATNIENWEIMSSGGYLESKNNFPFNFENNTFLNPNDDQIQNRNNNEVYQFNFFGKAVNEINDTSRIYFQGDYFDKKKNIPTIYNNKNARAAILDRDKSASVGYKNNEFFTPSLSSSLIAKITQKQTNFIDELGEIVLTPTLNKQTNNNLEAKIYFKYSKKNYELITSNTYRYEKLNIQDQIKNKSLRLNTRKLLSSSIGLNAFFLQDKLVISPVMRGLLSVDRYNGETQSITGEVLVKQLKKRYQTFSPQVGVKYEYSNNLSFSSNVSQYFRLPNYVELFGTRGYIGSSESLLPEEGVNFDIGFHYLTFIHSNKLTKFTWNMAYFQSKLDNEIVYVFAARGVGKPININQSSITGLENTFVAEFNYNILLTSSTTIQAPINTSNANNNLLPGRSFWFQKTRLSMTEGKYSTYAEHVAKSIYYLDSNEDLPVGETSLINLGIDMKYKRSQFLLSINNLTNQQIKDYYFQPMSGRAIFFTTKFNLI